ncbi:hypothetical protein CTAYLR_004692 [Chrysophaeum taylorii]|uniref:Calcineurin-like phosphoesterase domain-containing protein n=1 Tax=Chrysophaeum taylorii TaxID=2483200 RepID=A0AAD7U9E8_9STRA|nr:hypothetical protein CTAYLR_004692 [Chrysophaeum taylorii]
MSSSTLLYEDRFKATRQYKATGDYERFVRSSAHSETPRFVVAADESGEYPSKPADHVRVVCISDTHSAHLMMSPLPAGDILIHAGDFSKIGKRSEVLDFAKWFASQTHPHKVVIAGNHDLTLDAVRCDAEEFDEDPRALKADFVSALDGAVYLEDEAIEIDGLTIYGSPWTPVYGDWAFMLGRGEPSLDKWRNIPDGVDILVTHGPPLGRHDLCAWGEGRAGCIDLLYQVQQRIRPKVHVFGHIHEGYGASSDGVTDFVNPSTCNLAYRPDNHPIVLDVPTSAKNGNVASS